jgi:hypothetical protein
MKRAVGIAGGLSFLDRKKNAAIPAIRVEINAGLTKKIAVFGHFHAKVPRLRCQG